MTPEPSPPAPETGMSEFSRIIGIFFEPGKTFADIAERPRFIVPLLITIICGLAFTFAFTQHIGWERFMRQTMETSSRAAQIPVEQREKTIEMQSRFAPIMGYVGAIIGGPLYLLAAAALLMLLFNAIFSAELRFKNTFAVMCYAGINGIVFTALAIAVMFLKNPDDFNLRNPLAFNPGAFMDPTSSSKFVHALASSIDLFTFWTIFLIATGLAAAGRRLSFGKALTGVVSLWAIWVLIKSGAAGLFG